MFLLIGKISEHHDHLQVFERLAHFSLKINVNKCIFTVPQLTVLGHVIDNHGIVSVPEKVAISTTNIAMAMAEIPLINKDLFKVVPKS